jgi:glycogen operon protein
VTGSTHDRLFPDVSWHGVHAWTPDWAPFCRLLAAMFYSEMDGREDCVYVAANSHWEGHELELPELPDHLAWHLFADTCAEPSAQVSEPGAERLLSDQSRIHIGPRAMVVLLADQHRRSGDS